MTKLFETDHPYYATEGSYFAHGWHADYETWDEFLAEEGDNDLDMNLIYRWDWNTPDPADYTDDETVPDETLSLFYILQRKAATRSVSVTVTRDQEPAIREWLTVRANHLRQVWEPLLTGGAF